MKNYSPQKTNKFLTVLTLFTSLGTLLCCALPVLLVSLGLGATMVSLTTNIPQLIWLGEHKDFLFAFALVMISISSILTYRNRNAPCPLDPQLRSACLSGRHFSKIILIVSWIVLMLGFFFSYLAVYLIS